MHASCWQKICLCLIDWRKCSRIVYSYGKIALYSAAKDSFSLNNDLYNDIHLSYSDLTSKVKLDITVY